MVLTTEVLVENNHIDRFQEESELERQPESVIKLLLDRVERGYRREIDNDGHKVGLAFDPGGLAGIVSAAMANKLSAHGILDVVDCFYGLSAGGLNALYAAADQVQKGQLAEGMTIYTDFGPDKGLVKTPKALPPRAPRMDLDVLRDALYKSRQLNVKGIVEHKIPVVVGATDLSDPLKRPVMFKSTDLQPDEADKLIEQAIAGSHIMVVSGAPVSLDEAKSYTDATMAWASSIELARADGCTDILSLANAPEPKIAPQAGKVSKIDKIAGFVGSAYLDSKSPKLPAPYQGPGFKDYLRHPFGSLSQRILDSLVGDTGWEWDIQSYSDVLRRKNDAQQQFTDRTFMLDGVNVERLYPPDIPELPSLLTMDKKKLRVGVEAGVLASEAALADSLTNL